MKIPENGDILIVNLSPTSGHEQGGTRPVVVISNTDFNQSGMALTCPITSRTRNNFFEVKIDTKKTKGFILSYHLRSIDYVSRKAKIVDKIDDDILKEIIDKVKILIEGQV
jgi:mRNA interferase MazF